MGNLSNLTFLGLSFNQLSGGIPAELGNLSNLGFLFLSSNQLSGSLPQNLTNLNLARFHFGDTALCEPPDADFQAWLASITDLQSTGVICNEPPVAHAGGPYVGNVDDPITLDASGSFDPDGSIVLDGWDIDNDGEFDDATGVATDVTFGSPGTFTLGLRVTEYAGDSNIATTEVTIAGMCGDLNDDGLVNVFDAIITLQIIVGLIEPTESQLKLGDVEPDGAMTVFDSIRLLHHIVELAEITECGMPVN